MFHRFASWLSLFLLLVTTAAQAEFVPPHIALPGNGIKAHYVHLHGNSLIESSSNGGNEQLADMLQCQDWRNAMPKESTSVDHYIYSAQDRSIVVRHIEAYQIGIDCKPHKIIDQTTSHILTGGSYCTLMHKEKVAVGPCDLNAPERGGVGNPAVHKTVSAGKKTVEGIECTVYPSPLPNGFDVCIADGGNFHGFPAYEAPLFVRGVPVEYVYQKKVNSQAREIKFDMDVNPALFMIPKDFTIKGKPASGKRP